MVEATFEDLEAYLLGAEIEEWKEKTAVVNNFETIESTLSESGKFEEIFSKFLSTGRHQYVDLPVGGSYELFLDFSDDNLNFFYKWNSIRQYEKPYRVIDTIKQGSKYSEHLQTYIKSKPLSESELDSLLSKEISQDSPSEICSAIEFLESSEFNPSLPSIPSPSQSCDSEEELGLVLPNLSSDSDTRFAIEDTISLKTFDEEVPTPAIKYSFNLDDFQKRAILRLEQKQNVFVAAHTSAGKTVVAEYAIALARERMARVIYTSPIKALSNQKYREFKDQFGDIGILTGDVSVDEDSFCVIMTTEILRSMLYHNSSRLRDLEWVILDEVHYINDAERGVVWEEVLIMLPPHVRIVMLSATVPNYMEFSNWVGRVRNQKVFVQITYKRPVPLEHLVYVSGEFVKLVDADGTLNVQNYQQAKRDLEKAMNEKGKFDKGKKFKAKKKFARSEDQQYKDLILDLQKKDLLPCVIFAFSRDKVDKRAEKLSIVSLINDTEKHFINQFTSRALKRLNPVDRDLPQIIQVTKLLNSGIGIHHSGVLPILKEIVEILFSKGLIKVLVATETFAMGLNMPTKTVVFCELRKFDGSENRYLQPGEYTQMSGRAGRRGKDPKGTVIMFFKDAGKLPSIHNLEKIVQSKPLELLSKFRIRYNQIVNVLNTEGMDINEIMKKSFMENQNFISRQSVSTKLLVIDKTLKELGADSSETSQKINEMLYQLKELVEVNKQADQFGKKVKVGCFSEVVLPGSANVPALILSGALLLMDDSGTLKLQNRFPGGTWEIRKENPAKSTLWIFQTPLPKQKEKSVKTAGYFTAETVAGIFENFKTARASGVLSTDQSFKAKFQNAGLRNEMVERLRENQFLYHIDRHRLMGNHERIVSLQQEQEKLLKDSNSTDLLGSKETESRIEIMQKFNCLNLNLVVQLKGKVLGIFNNPYNLVITEAIFNGVFAEISPAEIAGTVSVFVTEEKAKMDELPDGLPDGLKNSIAAVKGLVEDLKEFEIEKQIASEITDQELKISMVEIVFLWAEGMSFVDICGKTSIKEGNIVRGILRVHDLLRNFVEAGIIMGDHNLKKKAKTAADLIQRDIAFATSLYISN
jgi:antiviral helicase SKI2